MFLLQVNQKVSFNTVASILRLISNMKCTVFIRSNTAAFIKFLAFPMRRLFEGGVYVEIIFLKSLTTVIVNRL